MKSLATFLTGLLVGLAAMFALTRRYDVQVATTTSVPLIIKVGVENRQDTGEPTNRIVGYKAVGEAVAQSAAAPPPLSQVQTPPAPAQKPANGGAAKRNPFARAK